jgi:hypothetical protein
MNNVPDSGFTTTVEPDQKIVQPDEGITITDLKTATDISSDSIPRSRIVPTGRLLSRKEPDATSNADSSDIPQPLISAVKAYKRLAYKGTSQAGMINW